MNSAVYLIPSPQNRCFQVMEETRFSMARTVILLFLSPFSCLSIFSVSPYEILMALQGWKIHAVLEPHYFPNELSNHSLASFELINVKDHSDFCFEITVQISKIPRRDQ